MALIAHYRLNGDAQDWLSGQDGVASNITWVDGKLGQAAQFQNIADCHVAIPSDLGYTTQVSVAAWFKSLGTPGSGYHIITGASRLEVSIPAAGALRVGIETSTGRKVHNHGGGLTDGQWHHVAMTFDGITKIGYIDGVEVGRVTVDGTLVSNVPGRAIGVFGVGSNYRTNGLIDDVRFYNHALSPREVRDLSLGLVLDYRFTSEDEDSSGVVVDKSGQGNNTTLGTNKPAWVEDSSGVGGSYYFSLGDRIRVPSVVMGRNNTMSAFAWIKPESGDDRATIVFADRWYFQFYSGDRIATYWYGRSPAGYHNSLANSVPIGEWSFVGVVWSDNDVKFYVNGALTNTVSSVGGIGDNVNYVDIGWQTSSRRYKGNIRSIKVYDSAVPDSYVKELYQQRASIDSEGSVHSGGTYETGYSPVIGPSYEAWTAGTTGAEPGFGTNGSASKSSRVIDDGPHGEQAVLWRATNTDTSSTADGGWNSATFPIDNTKTYRFSVWMRRRVQGNGRGYWGTHGYGSVNGVYPLGTSTPNTNPYFWAGGANESWGWFLIVGHIHPAGYTGPTHPDSARYTKDGYLGPISNDFVWLPETTSANHRAYLFYSTDLSTVQDMAYPRVDLCDGTEPTIQQLIDGFDLRWAQNGFPKELSVRNQLMLPRSSEVGVTRGLVAWYPLIGDTLDYAGTNHAVNNGAVATAEGYDFLGSTEPAYVETPGNLFTPEMPTFTVSLLAYNRSSENTGTLLANHYYGSIWESVWLSVDRVVVNSSNSRDERSIVYIETPVGEWFFITVTNDTVGGDLVVYINGQPVAYATARVPWDSTIAPSIGSQPAIESYGGRQVILDGVVADLRIHNVALTPEEVAIQAKLALNQATKSAMTQSCLYTKGQIKEVIA